MKEPLLASVKLKKAIQGNIFKSKKEKFDATGAGMRRGNVCNDPCLIQSGDLQARLFGWGLMAPVGYSRPEACRGNIEISRLHWDFLQLYHFKLIGFFCF